MMQGAGPILPWYRRFAEGFSASPGSEVQHNNVPYNAGRILGEWTADPYRKLMSAMNMVQADPTTEEGQALQRQAYEDTTNALAQIGIINSAVPGRPAGSLGSMVGEKSGKDIEEAARLWKEKGVESPYFKKWFGDSKVVDAEGKPLVVYHGTRAPNVESFRTNDNGFIYATPDPTYAGNFATGNAASVYPAYLSLKKPLDLRRFGDTEKHWAIVSDYLRNETNIDTKKIEAGFLNGPVWGLIKRPRFVEALKEAGYDGVVQRESGHEAYIAFDPTQIKSVFNRGTFDPNDPRILYSSPVFLGKQSGEDK